MTPDEFRETRKKLSLDQSQLGAILGVTQGHISRCENGREPISIPIAGYVRAMGIFGLPDDWPV